MTHFSWFGYEVEVDQAATSAWYARAGEWDCTCGHCRNFLALARRRELPAELLDILDGLSIPPEKATYVCEQYDQGGRLLYQLTYRLGGRVLQAPEGGRTSQIWCGRDNGPTSAETFPEPHFDFSLDVWLPWVLDEPIGGVPAKD